MKYTKSQLEEIVLGQLVNLEAMNNLVSTMKRQNELIERANIALRNDIVRFEKKHYAFAAKKDSRKS